MKLIAPDRRLLLPSRRQFIKTAAVVIAAPAIIGRASARVSRGSFVAPITPYLGPAATRAEMPAQLTTNQFNSQSFHYARTDISSLTVGYSNNYWPDFTNDLGATVFCGVQYPIGNTPSRVRWSSSTSLTVAQPLTYADPLAISIPKGSIFGVKFFVTPAPGKSVPCTAQFESYNAAGYDAMQWAASGLSDLTLSSSDVPNTAGGGTSGLGFFPAALLANTTQPTVAIIGDSIAVGAHDTPDTTGDLGFTARSIGGNFAYIKLAMSGESSSSFISNHAVRQVLAQTASHIIIEYGSNDLFFDAVSAATLTSRIASIIALFPGKKIILTTITPRTTSNDGWATLINQALVSAPDEAQRVTYNASVRAGVAGVSHFADATTYAESSLNSGLWAVNGSANYATAEGIHPSPSGYQNLIPAFNTAWFAYP